MLGELDRYIYEKIDELRGIELSYFYNRLAKDLRDDYFGGTWGFQGYLELIIYRILYHLLEEKYGSPSQKAATKIIKVFYYDNGGIVLGAGVPVKIGETRIWPDIIIYHPKTITNHEVKDISILYSVIEIKAAFRMKDVRRDVKRLMKIYENYNSIHNALIVYGHDSEKRSANEILNVLNLPDYIDFIYLKDDRRTLKEIFEKLTQI